MNYYMIGASGHWVLDNNVPVLTSICVNISYTEALHYIFCKDNTTGRFVSIVVRDIYIYIFNILIIFIISSLYYKYVLNKIIII